MAREWYWRGAFIALVTLGTIYLLVPSYYYFKLPPDKRNDKVEFEKVLPKWAPEYRLNLGLDLQGGIHLVMAVDVEAAMRAKTANRAIEIHDYLERKGLTGITSKAVGDHQVQITAAADKGGEVKTSLNEYFNDMQMESGSGDSLTYTFRPETVRFLKDGAVEQSIKAIRNRVDKFGVTEPTINRRGTNHILVQLPGFKDPEQAKELIGKTAQLEFRILDEQDESKFSTGLTLPTGVKLDQDRNYLVSTDQKALQDFVNTDLNKKAPQGRQFFVGHVDDQDRGAEYRVYLLNDKADMTGEYLTDARVQFESDGIAKQPYVSIGFNKRGADLFEKLTGENTGKRMAIVLDGVVNSAPTIRTKIAGGNARIDMGRGSGGADGDSMKEAQNLALVLKAGALPAPVTVAEQRTVGASLGPELINSGAKAVVAGLILVVLFMLLYYRLSGFIADLALLLNGLLILSSLALFGASLSLPGIAGIVLTLGVAVDANVIINERIREELRAGKSPRTAVQLGYEKAFAAIFDSNLTTVLSGIVLLQYGTGPIRGFAVALIIGVTASMFTAIVVTRWMMDFLVAKRPERLSV
jgi:preprotein translocase subunit SecD